GGLGLGRGYLNQPALTAQRFVPNPFPTPEGGVPSARLYRTGDLVRWDEAGELDYLGRLDEQVKIRGFRIELGEIEQQLLQVPHVAAAVVTAEALGQAGRRLVAFVVPEQPGSAPDDLPAVCRAQLAQVLPDYMVPSQVVVLDQLPMTVNGKVDRAALAQALSAVSEQRPHAAPCGPMEVLIASVWQDMLGVSPVGRDDNFFDLGGHSLAAVQLMARLRQRLGIEVPLRRLFEHPTLAEFAASLEGGRAGGHLVRIRPAGQLTPLFLVHPGEGEVDYVRRLAAVLDPDLPLYALAATGLAPGETPLDDITEIARRYVNEVRAVQPDGPYRLGGWSAGGNIAYEMARQLIDAGATVSLLALIDSAPPGAVGEGVPLPTQADAQAQAHAAGVTDLDADTLRRHLAVRAALARALSRQQAVPVPTTVTLYIARDERRTPPPHGWEHLLGRALRTRVLAGDHYSLVEPPHIAALAAALTLDLAASQPAPAP
ncbi:MAG: AMP-binding protein, partial [Pelomonas sp.]|nr:AMP-binding protein [Roseateles sp.]